MKLLTQQPHGTIVQFIEDRMSHNWHSEEQAEAMVREYFFLVAGIVCDPDRGFRDEAIRTFPKLDPFNICLESCIIWLLRLTLWQCSLIPDELMMLGRDKVTWA